MCFIFLSHSFSLIWSTFSIPSNYFLCLTDEFLSFESLLTSGIRYCRLTCSLLAQPWSQPVLQETLIPCSVQWSLGSKHTSMQNLLLTLLRCSAQHHTVPLQRSPILRRLRHRKPSCILLISCGCKSSQAAHCWRCPPQDTCLKTVFQGPSLQTCASFPRGHVLAPQSRTARARARPVTGIPFWPRCLQQLPPYQAAPVLTQGKAPIAYSSADVHLAQPNSKPEELSFSRIETRKKKKNQTLVLWPLNRKCDTFDFLLHYNNFLR